MKKQIENQFEHLFFTWFLLHRPRGWSDIGWLRIKLREGMLLPKKEEHGFFKDS